MCLIKRGNGEESNELLCSNLLRVLGSFVIEISEGSVKVGSGGPAD
jgi:hypothetical protein